MLSESLKSTVQSLHCDCPLDMDLIIRSADGTQLHIDRKRIATASPILLDMLYLAQSTDVTLEKSVLDVTESGVVWEHILYMCQHPPEPTLDYTQIQPLLEAGKKYSIASVKERVAHTLRRPEILDQKPMSVYALACAYGLPDIALLAARRTLPLGPVFEYVPELAAISGRAYHNLLDYRQKCSIAARAVVARSTAQNIPEWADVEEEIKNIVVCSEEDCESKAQYYYRRETDYHIREAWLTYLTDLERSLETKPDGAVATSVEMLEPVMVSAAECVACARKIYGQAMAFSKAVEKRIEEAVSKVELVVEP